MRPHIPSRHAMPLVRAHTCVRGEAPCPDKPHHSSLRLVRWRPRIKRQIVSQALDGEIYPRTQGQGRPSLPRRKENILGISMNDWEPIICIGSPPLGRRLQRSQTSAHTVYRERHPVLQQPLRLKTRLILPCPVTQPGNSDKSLLFPPQATANKPISLSR